MDFNEYQQLAKTTVAAYENKELALAIFTLGLVGEAGEVSEVIKKHLGHGHPLDKEKVEKELGDVFWYLAVLSDFLELKLEDIAVKNIEKLKKRYPEGFSSQKSINRKD